MAPTPFRLVAGYPRLGGGGGSARSVEGLEIGEIFSDRKVYKIPLTQDEYFLLEHRRADGSYYNSNIPQDGLLIWHVDERADNDEERHKQVDLVCADGLFAPNGDPDVSGRTGPSRLLGAGRGVLFGDTQRQ